MRAAFDRSVVTRCLSDLAKDVRRWVTLGGADSVPGPVFARRSALLECALGARPPSTLVAFGARHKS